MLCQHHWEIESDKAWWEAVKSVEAAFDVLYPS
jgi:hypothetical protein